MTSRNGKNGKAHSSGNPTVSNGDGKDPATGKFLPGNTYGRGNPIAVLAVRLRRAMLEAITPKDMELATQRILDIATGADGGDDPKVRLAAFKVIADAINSSKAAGDIDTPTDKDGNEFIREQVRELMKMPRVAEAVAEETLRA